MSTSSGDQAGTRTSAPAGPVTAVVLVGFQNDFFAPDGLLRGAFDESARLDEVLERTVFLLQSIGAAEVPIFSVPIVFSHDYRELEAPVGVLATIRDVGAFRTGSTGAALSTRLRPFEDRMIRVEGRSGFDAFEVTGLDAELRSRGVTDVLVAGAVTSLCIDATVRSAAERQYRVAVLRDCTLGRTRFEHDFFCDRVFPLYAEVLDSVTAIRRLFSDAA